MRLDTQIVPAEQTDSKRLMVVLHGLGDSMEGFRWLPQALNLPWLNFLLVNAPDPYFTGFSWYDFADDPGPGIARSRRLLCELLEEQAKLGFTFEQTLLFGFSQGALMTIEVGCRFPHRLAGLIGISGYVHEPETVVRELSSVADQQQFLITHGTQDPLLPFDKVRHQIRHLQQAGLNIAWHPFEKAHTIAGEAEIALIRQFIQNRFV